MRSTHNATAHRQFISTRSMSYIDAPNFFYWSESVVMKTNILINARLLIFCKHRRIRISCRRVFVGMLIGALRSLYARCTRIAAVRRRRRRAYPRSTSIAHAVVYASSMHLWWRQQR